MRYLLIIFGILVTLGITQAQVLNGKKDSVETTLNKKIKDRLAIDSAANGVNDATDKIEVRTSRVDSVAQHKLSKVDSVSGKAQQKLEKLNNVSNPYTDSVNAVVGKYYAELKTTENRLAAKIDSLKNTGKLTGKQSGKVDSLSNLDPASVAQIKHLEQQLNDQQSRIDKIRQGADSGLKEKMDLMAGQSYGQGNLPKDVNVPGLPTGQLGKLPETKLPETKLPDLPGASMPTMGQPSLDLPKQDIGLQTGLEIPGKDKVQDLKGLPKVTENVKGVTGEVKDIRSGDIPSKVNEEELLKQAPVSEEIGMIQKNDQVVKEQQAKLNEYKNMEEYKKQTLQRAKKMVAVQMATYEKEIQESVSKLTRYQSKMGGVLSKKGDLPKKRDPLRKLKTFEKMVPGLAFQVLTAGDWLIDVAPSLRYRITSYWSAGLAWNERIDFNDDKPKHLPSRISGPRMFSEVVLFKGLSFKLDVESMNFNSIQLLQDTRSKKSVWSYAVGAKKDFSFAPRVTGNVQLMYNVYASDTEKIYPSRFNTRFGFEYKLKKRKK